MSTLRTEAEAAVEAWLAATPRLQQLLTYKALNASGLRIGSGLDREVDALTHVAAMRPSEQRFTLGDIPIRVEDHLTPDELRLWAACFAEVHGHAPPLYFPPLNGCSR